LAISGKLNNILAGGPPMMGMMGGMRPKPKGKILFCFTNKTSEKKNERKRQRDKKQRQGRRRTKNKETRKVTLINTKAVEKTEEEKKDGSDSDGSSSDSDSEPGPKSGYDQQSANHLYHVCELIHIFFSLE
jgi:hypothetical protein